MDGETDQRFTKEQSDQLDVKDTYEIGLYYGYGAICTERRTVVKPIRLIGHRITSGCGRVNRADRRVAIQLRASVDMPDNPSLCLRTSKPSSLVWLIYPSLNMSSSSSYYHNEHLFRAPYHKEIYQKYIHRKGVTPEKSFELQEGQYPEVGEQIRLRGWRRLRKLRTKISKDLVHEFYTNAVRTEEELASGEYYPYTSFVRGKEVDFSAAKIREVLRIKHMTLGAETDFKSRQYKDQRLDEVIREICMPGAQWKMSSSQPPHPIQLRRQDLAPVARGWAEFIIHSMIPTGNKSEIIVARVVLIHSIIKGHDVRVEELIANNITVLDEAVQGRSKLCFSSTIYRLWKEAGVPMGEFRNSEQIQIARPITAKVMTTTKPTNGGR
ncbi:hypothetical protein PIB30_081004 [Stylosanthes scabra]|uniref:Putative plant transposon protein domain-containing protein n=1 Tax=Stylosanthes scabra TaxID=79078 RepID=A0ABU6RRG1_9FABA|nr:hypothetical protein [Stylosanthes scabra]